METTNKNRSLIEEKAPWLAVVFQNKYAEMIYDRFASFPPKKQKQIVLWTLAVTGFVVLVYLVSSYWALWSTSSSTQELYSMNNLILQFQKSRRDRSEELQLLNRNASLAAPGQLKQFLLQTSAGAGISPRMIQVEERAEAGVGGNADTKKKEVRIKESTVSLQRINLTQLITYLKSIEYGNFNLSVSSIKISNDDKLRGYLNADLSILAYLFDGDEG